MHVADVTIDPRYSGPPGYGNGGYVAGLLGVYATDAVEVRLRAPAPLGRSLALVADADGTLELRAGEQLLATAVPASLDLAVPEPVAAATAAAASLGYRARRGHPIPDCFVCGPANAAGLQLAPGPLEHAGRTCVATPWRPDAALAGTRRTVRPEFVWAALDCPGYFAAVPDLRPMLLGSLTGRVDGTVEVGEDCVVLAWRLGGEGRKHRAATALYGADGRCVARAVATWIELKTAS